MFPVPYVVALGRVSHKYLKKFGFCRFLPVCFLYWCSSPISIAVLLANGRIYGIMIPS